MNPRSLGAAAASVLFASLIPLASLAQISVEQTGELGKSRAFLPVVDGPDTVWIGHVNGPTGLPGALGGYGPYHIGRGPDQIVWPPFLPAPPTSSYDGVWDWDHFQVGEPDSSQGWWMVAAPYDITFQTDLPDHQRPWFALDYGNQGNYVSNVVNCPAPCLGPPTPAKRTFGVTGYWHRDWGALGPMFTPLPGTTPVPPTWLPLAGTASAWCGLRSHGDNTFTDALIVGGTGNAFNQSLLQYNGGGVGGFPGYGGQWDQMLYRDVELVDGEPMTISFMFSTNMSTAENPRSDTRTGWFELDPLKPAVVGDGNFVSSSAGGAPRPVDVFRVYVGVPVERVDGPDNDFMGSDGLYHDIYDVQRRWFSEVIAIDKPYAQLFSATGVNPPGTVALPTLPGGSGTFLQSILDAQPGPGGLVRIVFRVKTNRGFDDEDGPTTGFSSGTAGAAIVDEVEVSPLLLRDGFEAYDAIENDSLVPATSRWKSTGKPPGVYFHLHDLMAPMYPLPYDDPCGSIGAPGRHCNMMGAVATAGDHDNGESPGGPFGSNFQDRRSWLVSPTVNLCSLGQFDYNGMGIDAEIADATADYVLWFDVHQNLFDYRETGIAYRIGWQSYPDLQPNGVRCWGPALFPDGMTSNAGQPGCAAGFGGNAAGAFARLAGLIRTSNTSGIPDSLRCYVEVSSMCFTLPLTVADCSPSTGSHAGGYFDNLSMGFVDGWPSPSLTVDAWDLFNDAFPANVGGMPAAPAAYDTIPARVRTGRNISQQTRSVFRHNIPGDSAIARAPGAGVRCDLVFRIKPGVGNYFLVGNPGMPITTFPGSGVPAAGVPGNFWGSYMSDVGVFGSNGVGPSLPHDPDGPLGPIPPGTVWDPNAWNSARMDTVETNLFPTTGVLPNLGQLTPGFYASQYHEADPRYSVLGVAKPRCFLIANAPGSAVNCTPPPGPCNITCGDPALGPYPPNWARILTNISGFDPYEVGTFGDPHMGYTYEYTRILPDGQFTPGTHVEYFFRKSIVGAPAGQFEMTPDTNFIYPQIGEWNFDGHRWQEFAVLPDRWKDPAFGGAGMACMLVVDLGDRRGDELRWVAIADSTGMTASARHGAHDGWRWDPTRPSIVGRNVGGDDFVSVRAHLGQAGTTWDLYQVKGGETNVPAGRLGSRYASTIAPGLAAGKFSTLGPASDMLNTFYRTIVLLAADLGEGALGPYIDQTDDDLGVINGFFNLPGGTALPRGMFAIGANLVQGQEHLTYGHPWFFPLSFGASLRSGSYRTLSGNTADIPDLITSLPMAGGTYGVYSPCQIENDVFTVNGAVSTAIDVASYAPVGGGGGGPPYDATIYAPQAFGRTFTTMVSGWTLGPMGGMGTEDIGVAALLTSGARRFVFDALSLAFTALNCAPPGSPLAVGDQPGLPGSAFVNYLALRSANPARSGEARIVFSLAKTERVEVRILDVSGRIVRTAANRVFTAGQEHAVIWDGTTDAGQRVPSGVYFYQLKTPTWASRRKLTVLRD